MIPITAITPKLKRKSFAPMSSFSISVSLSPRVRSGLAPTGTLSHPDPKGALGVPLGDEARRRARGGVQAGAAADDVRRDGRAARDRDQARAAEAGIEAAPRARARRRAA